MTRANQRLERNAAGRFPFGGSFRFHCIGSFSPRGSSAALGRLCFLVVFIIVALFAVGASGTLNLAVPVTHTEVAAAVALERSISIAASWQRRIIWVRDAAPAAVDLFQFERRPNHALLRTGLGRFVRRVLWQLITWIR